MNNPLRTIARSAHWQNLYARAKELNLNLFSNNCDFGRLQSELLQWLEIYHGIYVDIASGEGLMTYERIEDDILVDCYLIYKSSQNKKEKQSNKKGNKFKGGKTTNDLPSTIFRSKRKK